MKLESMYMIKYLACKFYLRKQLYLLKMIE